VDAPHRLQENTAKTEVLWSTTSRRLICYLSYQSEWAPTKSSQFPLYATSASTSMRSHVKKTVAACFAILRLLRSVLRSVPRSVLQSSVSYFVLQRLDYDNATLAGVPSHLLKRVQLVMNSAACVFCVEVRPHHAAYFMVLNLFGVKINSPTLCKHLCH